jgi:hypothetical protein
MLNLHKVKYFEKHDIDDGNSRAFTYTMLGLAEVPAFVGEYELNIKI